VSITLNGQTVGGGGFTSLPGGQVDGRILNNAAQSAQVSYFSSGGTGGIFGSSPTATTVNTAIPQTLLINGQLGNVGDTMTLNGYCVELLQQ
jgi:hypothetical protein